jgi:hypothetical protein
MKGESAGRSSMGKILAARSMSFLSISDTFACLYALSRDSAASAFATGRTTPPRYDNSPPFLPKEPNR